MLLYHLQNMILRILAYFWDLFRLGAVFNAYFRLVMRLVERDFVPDIVIRLGIRALLKIRLISVSMRSAASIAVAIDPTLLTTWKATADGWHVGAATGAQDGVCPGAEMPSYSRADRSSQ